MTTWNARFCLAHIHQPCGFHHPTATLPALMNAAEAGAGLFPTKRITADKQPMLERAASAPETRWRAWARGCPAPLRAPRLQRSLCHPAVIGRRIELTADLARVRVSRARP